MAFVNLTSAVAICLARMVEWILGRKIPIVSAATMPITARVIKTSANVNAALPCFLNFPKRERERSLRHCAMYITATLRGISSFLM